MADLPINDIIAVIIARNSLSEFLSVESTPTVFRNGVLIHKNIPRPETLIIGKDGQRFDTKGNRILYIPQTRIAVSDDDFHEIFEREFNRKKLTDSPEICNVFRDELYEHTTDLIELHKSNTKFEERDIPALATASRFKEWLSSPNNKLAAETPILAVALAEYYKFKTNEGVGINADNSKSIAANAGWNSPSSGRKLQEKFNSLHRGDYLRTNSGKRKVIGDITKAIRLLPPDSKAVLHAQKDLSTLTN